MYYCLQQDIFDYLYYLSGVIVVLAYIISTQTTVNDRDVTEATAATAALLAQFDQAALKRNEK